ncbi:MAG: SDR family oxidoreductase [Armatimonadetes bacterium]|nr:SDR family oxidoreductase [Armatimonadota bacterium]
MTVADHVTLITGAGGALGAVTSRRFMEEGARLVICDMIGHKMEEMGREFGSDRCIAERVDVTNAVQVAGLVKRAVERFGRIDILLNIAGGHFGAGPVAEVSEEDFDKALSVNLKSTFLMCRAVVPHMVQQGWGRIVNVGARAGLSGRARSAAHAASKGGVILLTEALAEEVRDHGVTANVVIPSFLDTPANREAEPDADFSRWVPPEHVAATMLFLCSDEAQSITGARITVFNRT